MIMAQNAFYPEDVLIEKMESGEYGWLDYVNHFSAEWQDELAEYCTERALKSTKPLPSSSSITKANN